MIAEDARRAPLSARDRSGQENLHHKLAKLYPTRGKLLANLCPLPPSHLESLKADFERLRAVPSTSPAAVRRQRGLNDDGASDRRRPLADLSAHWAAPSLPTGPSRLRPKPPETEKPARRPSTRQETRQRRELDVLLRAAPSDAHVAAPAAEGAIEEGCCEHDGTPSGLQPEESGEERAEEVPPSAEMEGTGVSCSGEGRAGEDGAGDGEEDVGGVGVDCAVQHDGEVQLSEATRLLLAEAEREHSKGMASSLERRREERAAAAEARLKLQQQSMSD